mmetsp:Transcript_26567/g.89377  ORF Transcript_26567/g.89377 Transcript_26567/m.89377 type:complete len:396 (-) Transcript_26567:8-1195(-)
MAILRSILCVLLLGAAMPSHATSVHGASMQVAARPGAATRALDAADAVLGDISNVTADGRKKNKGKTGPRKLRPPIEQLRNALTLYVTEKYTVALPITQKKAGAKFGVEAHQMQKMTLKITADTFEGKLGQIAGLEWSLPGRPDVVAGVYFDEDEQDIIAAVVAERCRMGFPLDAEGLGAYCAELLVKLGRGTDSTTGKPRKCSAHWVRDFIKEHNLASYKSSAIDPARARQATPEVRDTFFDLVEEVTAREFAAGKITWAMFAQVPDANKYNMDEEGKDANKGRKSVLGPAPAPKKKTNESFVDAAAEAPLRVYERTDGDHAPHHFTNVETSCATGVCVIPNGIVHSSPGNENPSMTLALLENIVVLATTDELRASPYHRDGYVRLEGIEGPRS